MELNGTQLEALRDALIEAFDLPSLRQMVRIGLDENLDAIAGGANLKEITFNLLEWAEHTGRIDKLLAAARHENPSSRALSAFEADYRPNPGTGSQGSVPTQQYNVAGDVYNLGQVTGTTIVIGRSAHAGSSVGDTTDAAATS
jgi:hypothetical protein